MINLLVVCACVYVYLIMQVYVRYNGCQIFSNAASILNVEVENEVVKTWSGNISERNERKKEIEEDSESYSIEVDE